VAQCSGPVLFEVLGRLGWVLFEEGGDEGNDLLLGLGG
jgi:hypothetical protein